MNWSDLELVLAVFGALSLGLIIVIVVVDVTNTIKNANLANKAMAEAHSRPVKDLRIGKKG